MAAIDSQVCEGYTVLSITGELDFVVEQEVKNAWMEALTGHPRALLVDLTAVPLLDSCGIRLLLAGYQRTRQRGIEVAMLLSAEGHVRRILELIGLSQSLPLFFEREAALQSLEDRTTGRSPGTFPESAGDRLALSNAEGR